MGIKFQDVFTIAAHDDIFLLGWYDRKDAENISLTSVQWWQLPNDIHRGISINFSLGGIAWNIIAKIL